MKNSPTVRRKQTPRSARQQPATPQSTTPRPARPAATRPPVIVGIGASAGGLEALEAFLAHVPADSGMAFVVIQHLDRTHKCILVELLQRVTRMPVSTIRDRTKVRPNCVYVLPPNKEIAILHGTLQLQAAAPRPGVFHPIDGFFRSLAQDQQERAVGVILSGMGTDGTDGLRAIQAVSGVGFVQDPASAKFDSMPRSAINAGLADFVAPAEELPAKLSTYWLQLGRDNRPALPVDDLGGAFGKVVLLLRSRTGNDFSLYRRSTLQRRLERRMRVHQLDKLPAYLRFLQENPQEIDILFKELLIGVTSFFRDPIVWEYLSAKILPALLAERKGTTRTLRAWVAGCSTGEEAYSLAIAFREAMDQVRPEAKFSLQIYATDLDQDAIAVARKGVYPDSIAGTVSSERLARFFVRDDHGYRVSREVRETVIFAPQNFIMDPPFTKLDLLSCRNLLIYLTPELQKKLFPLFHYSLNPGGILFLGSAESIGDFTSLFSPCSSKERIFRRADHSGRRTPVEFPARTVQPAADFPPHREPEPTGHNLQALVDQLLLREHTPAAVLVNTEGDILYVNGRTGKYLEPAAGKANWNVLAMVREELRYDLTSALRKALRDQKSVRLRCLGSGSAADTPAIDLEVRPLAEPPALQGMALILFSEGTGAPRKGATALTTGSRLRLAELTRALQEAREEVRASREEMQSSQEELKSMNEEQQSANEELQSANEELTTSKEEMQSLNEELQTVNAELQAKLEELSAANNDMKNLLNSTNIATVFLDDALCVRRFTSQASQLFKFIPGDLGRPITDLANNLRYAELVDDAREVLRTLVFIEKTIETHDARWFTVRIMPYRTIDNRIAGVVITFMETTLAKQLEIELRDKCRQLGELPPGSPSGGNKP